MRPEDVLARLHPWGHRTAGALLLVSFAIMTGAWLVAGVLSGPAQARLGAPPKDLDAEVVHIPSVQGPLTGWWTVGQPGLGAVLLLHGVWANRAAMLGHARFLHAAGYGVLLVDLPAHGESAGDQITFGVRESDGARAAVAELRRRAPGERIGALGVSLGGASLLLGTPTPAANATDAVILEEVYPSISEAVANRLRIRLGALGPVFTPLLTVQLRPRLGMGAEVLRPIDRMPALRVPVLVIAGEVDQHTTLAESRRLYAAAPAPKAFWVVPGAPHGNLHVLARTEYERRVLAFFGRHLRRAS